jgi:hypothetical protein
MMLPIAKATLPSRAMTVDSSPQDVAATMKARLSASSFQINLPIIGLLT